MFDVEFISLIRRLLNCFTLWNEFLEFLLLRIFKEMTVGAFNELVEVVVASAECATAVRVDGRDGMPR